MKAYHLFRLADAHFAYHIPAGRFIAISPEAYEFLRARQEGESPVPDAQLRDDIRVSFHGCRPPMHTTE